VQRPTWTFELLDLAGTAQAFLSARTATITRRLNGSSQAEIVLDAQATGAGEVDDTSHLVRCWRRGPSGGSRILRHAGRISGAIGNDATDSPSAVTLTVHDPLHLLDDRLRASQVTYTNQTPRHIVNALVGDENTRSTVHLRVAAGTGGPNRDRTYEVGKNVGEIITQLSEVQGGFYYVVNPVPDDADPAIVGELVLRHPDPGTDRPAVRFERGPGTIGNLTEAGVTVLPPINRVTGFGAGEGDDQLVVSEEDAASIAAHGLYESSVQHVDVTIEQTLRDHCTDALRPEPRRTLALEVATPGSVFVPFLWDDFDVGDTVYIEVRSSSPVASYTGSAIVAEATVSIDDQGNETLTGLQVVTPGA